MKVLAFLGLLALFTPTAHAGGAAARVVPVKGGGVTAVQPKIGLGGASYKIGGKTLADWDFTSLPISQGLRVNFMAPPVLETPGAEAGAGALHAEAMAETLAAPDLHLGPADALILDPGPGTPPAAEQPQTLAVKSAAIKTEIQKVGPIGGLGAESAVSLGRRVLDLLTGSGSMESSGSALKPAAGLARSLSGATASAPSYGLDPAVASPTQAQELRRPNALSLYVRSPLERVPPPAPIGFETLAGEPTRAPLGWTAALRRLPGRVTRIAMNAFELGLAFTPKLTKTAPDAPESLILASVDASAPASSNSGAPLILEPKGEELRDAVASVPAASQGPLLMPEASGETFAFFQHAGADAQVLGADRRPAYRGAETRRFEPTAPDPASGLFLASLLPLVGLTLLIGYRLN